ncbi:Uncharacterized protein Rs2_19743 [Raphanus sativus]|uniref:Uncharacterized protein LOC108860951 n=1 Tax=Raphanus sativus TaxID=3726 RepID=A0A6J0P2X8_RAPSA|nr:uncharacterized protein LOC108860951 [Raphanus sativus]KAJ4892949.1 Uncharacterized protein Rs2_19743 [Raphanus sativus]
MKFAKSVVAHSYRRGKPFGRHSFNNGARGMAANRIPDKPVVLHGSMAPGLAFSFGFTGYLIWQMVEVRRMSKAADKDIEYHREARLRNIRICEGHREISRLRDKNKAEPEAEVEVEVEAEPEAKMVEEDMEMPWWCGSA